MSIRVGVIFGGKTVEHEVSIISAVQAMKSLNSDKYIAVPIYISKNKEMYTGKLLKEIESYKDINKLIKHSKNVTLYNEKGRYFIQTKGIFKKIIEEVDIVLPIVHGNNVEDGTIQGFLETIGVPYVGSGVIASAMGQDKVFMKQIFSANDISIVDYTWFYDFEYKENKDKIINEILKLNFPVIVKPATLGSSVGIAKADNMKELIDAINEAIKYDNKIVVEKVIQDLTEVNCSVLGTYEDQKVSEIEEVMSTDEFLTYKDKYLGSGGKSKGMASTNRIIPARIDNKTRKEVKHIARKVFKVLNLAGVCRIDFLIDKKENKVYINEPNTIPGSLSYYLWEPIGKKYDMLLDEMISIAIRSYKKKQNTIYSFDTNILENFNGLKGNKGKLR
ncbi:MAG: D-alanine--D-alanine ligase family protein [Ignavibacteriales bacterium]